MANYISSINGLVVITFVTQFSRNLLNEYKYRYDKNEHKTEIVGITKNNIPNHFKQKTKLLYKKY